MASRVERKPMERRRLVSTDIDGLRPFKDRRREIIDTGCEGLRLRITSSGKKSWSVVYRVSGGDTGGNGTPKKGKPRRVTLGSTELPYKEARRMALEVVELAAEGVDYIEKRREEAEGRNARSVEALIERFIDEYAKRKGREDLARNWLEKPELKRWHGRDLSDIARSDIHKLLDRVAVERGRAAVIEMRKHLSKLFHWAVDRELIQSNPITRLDRDEVYRERDRVLSLDELRRVWDAAGELGYPFGPMYRLLILTGQRRAEIGEMERGWLKKVRLDADDEEAVPAVVIPPSKHKSRRGHTFYLSPPAAAILDDLPDLGGKFLLSSTAGKTPVSGYSKAKARMERELAKRNEKDELEPLDHWTVHDIRRSVATGMSEMGIPGEHIEHVLGHSMEKLRRTYNKNAYASEVRDAMLRWGELWT